MDWCSRLRELTEFRTTISKKADVLDIYVKNFLNGNKNLIIKEDWFMLEILKNQRENYVAELELLRQENLDAIKAERFEMLKDQVAAEVEREHNEKMAEVEVKISHYDFVIKMEEEKLAVEVPEATEEVVAEV